MAALVEEIDSARFSDPESFQIAVAMKGEPIVFRGLCANWPAVRAAAQSWESLTDYLRRLDFGALAQAFIGPPSIAGRYNYSDDFEGFQFRAP